MSDKMRIMVQGTMSDAGKSILATALCRIFRQDGYSVCPFKSQNMALNSCITAGGLEMGRAQAVQAEASGKSPDARMNPILLKPSSDTGSQLVVVGEVRGNVTPKEYYAKKSELVPYIMDAYRQLEEESDVMVIEGAGSPAEINLKEFDIVNMGFAKMVNAPVLLAGDIDRGGVFAQLYGTYMLMDGSERSLMEGMIINKFRGDPDILTPGLSELEKLTGKPVLGVVPMIDADIDDEDSLSERMKRVERGRTVDIAVIRLPRISNFTDFAPLEHHPDLGVRFVRKPGDLGDPDMIIIPGTKSTIDDLLWMRENGIEDAVKEHAAKGKPVLGVCGGYQMLGEELLDPDHIESRSGSVKGMGLLPTVTTYLPEKRRTNYEAEALAGPFRGAKIRGYEIHMGRTEVKGDPLVRLETGEEDGCVKGSVFGTYLHGLFDTGEMTTRAAEMLLRRKGVKPETVAAVDHGAYKEEQYDKLADAVRSALDINRIYEIMDKYKE